MDEQQPLSKKELKAQRRQEKLNAHSSAEKRQTRERLILWGVVAVLIIGIFVVIWKMGGGNATTTYSGKVKDVVADDHIEGNPNAKVTLYEYSDFQCPACGAAHPFIKDLVAKDGANFRLVYRHFPLAQHQNAQIAAQAAEAANLQGKFWPMHDLLFEYQNQWAEQPNAAELFVRYASTLGMDPVKFKTDMESQVVIDRVARDANEGVALGVNATPSFYLGQNLLTLTSYTDLTSAIEGEINKK